MSWLLDERQGWLQTPWVVWIAAGVFALGWGVMGWWMFSQWLYPGYDLAIFDQVVWNTAHGDWFGYSFNPYSYLADHREWALVLLAPLYWAVPHPVMLLVVQALLVGFTAVPLYRVAVRAWRSAVPQSHRWHHAASWVGLGVVGMFLLHPSVHGMLSYEFHALTLTVPFVCWLWDAVQRGRLGQMWAWVGVVLLIRDDMALVVCGVGVLLWCVRELPLRQRVWHGCGVVVVGVAWFMLNQWIGSAANPEGVSKFFVFYEWMGGTPLDALVFGMRHPLQVVSMALQFDHVFAPLFFLASVGGLAVLRPRLLIPAILPLTVLFIDRPVGVALVKLHYSAFVVPWTLMAAAEGVAALVRRLVMRPEHWVMRIGGGMTVVGCVVGAMVVFQSVVLSPFRDVWIQYHSLSRTLDESYEQALSFVGPEDSVMASRRLYTRLAHRKNLYPTLHVHTGVQHYSTVPYEPPMRVDWLLLETEEVLGLEVASQGEWREGAGQRFQEIITANQLVVRYESADVMVYGPADSDGVGVQAAASPLHDTAIQANDDIRVSGWALGPTGNGNGDELWLRMERSTPRRTNTHNLHVRVQWRNDSGETLDEVLYPIGAGVSPTSEWAYDHTPHVIRIPVTRPQGATAVTVSVGPVIAQPVFPFVVLAQPVQLDPEESVVVGTAVLP